MKQATRAAPGGRPYSRHELALWLRSTRGRQLLASEERELRSVLPDLFGRHILQIGNWGRNGRLLAGAEMLHRAVLGTVRDGHEQAVVEPDRLPVQSKTVDAALLPHTLEFSRHPHQVLREVNRILTDRGTLLILGFNPYSLWSLRRHFGMRYRAFPEGARFLSIGRLTDWLELLDFEITRVRRFGVGFPWLAPHDDAMAVALSEAYLLEAKKRVIPLTFVGRPQRAKVAPILGGVALPEARVTRS